MADPVDATLVAAAERSMAEYVAVLDARDWDAMRRLLAPEAFLEFDDRVLTGADAVLGWMGSVQSSTGSNQHLVSDVRAVQEGEDRVRVHCRFRVLTVEADEIRVAQGAYSDTFDVTSGRWRLHGKRIRVDEVSVVRTPRRHRERPDGQE
jgi:hypothetical protein